ncbi:MAG TPA: radical SAM protein [Thermoguttaceae bacterium]|nr:radical SAM protein [Thermoguttaceae bacterium]
MATQARPPLASFTDWVWATDPAASQHLPLLERAAELLAGQGDASVDRRRSLAAKLEAWRCRHLDERFGGLAPEDRRLADALDLAANELAGGDPRPPRAAHEAIHDTSHDPGPIAEAKAALDSDVELDEVARRARRLTDERFRAPGSPDGSARRRMLLYAPLYLSSYCTNYCAYCGFRHPNRIERRHLSVEEALHEGEILRSRGFRHILLVAGDDPRWTTPEYYAAIIRALVARGIAPGIEIAPQSTDAYAELVAAGACGITLYQETYHEELYALYHPQGTKASFHWRLEGIERAAEASMGRLGLGVLLGLADPQEDLLALMRHALYLRGRFPDRRLAFSLPRIYKAPEGFQPPYRIDDETFVRFYCALRIAFPDAELVLSTREPAPLRNRLARICITQMSAGSRTVPGGYEAAPTDRPCGQQFPVSDHRSPAEVATWLQEAGIEPVWEIPQPREVR